MKKLLLLLVVMLAVQRLPAQDTNAPSFAPLFIITNGMGKVVPFQDGEMLEVGRKYDMAAVADPHYEFSSWQRVTIFMDIVYTENQFHQRIEVETDIVAPSDEYYYDPVLHFKMEDTFQVLLNIPGVREIAVSGGWQANFVPRTRKEGDR
jgi:hypothetical protein